LTVDLPGHGDSPALPSDRPAFELVCAQLLAVVEAAGLRSAPLSVVGYSLGARVAMALLGHLSQRLKQAILISGHPGLDEPDARAQRLQVDRERAARLVREGLPAFVDQWYRAPLLATLHRAAHADAIVRRRRQGDADALARTLIALSTGHQPLRLPTIAKIAPHVHWMAGEDDTKYRSLLRHAAVQTPGSGLHIIPGAGHHVHLEQPKLCAAAIRRALVSQGGRL
ncbi:MAG: alpha/beta fold hydrolase, partial [Myxococcales bacterium]|nr:alpha/beta fold hydrolase [Myxococcales bacterium]